MLFKYGFGEGVGRTFGQLIQRNGWVEDVRIFAIADGTNVKIPIIPATKINGISVFFIKKKP